MQAALTASGRSLAAPFGRRGEPVPAGGGPGGIGFLPARRRGDGAVLERGAELVADPVERGDHLAGEAAGLDQHGIDGFLVELAIKPLGQRGFEPGGVLERKGDVGNRGVVGHGTHPSAWAAGVETGLCGAGAPLPIDKYCRARAVDRAGRRRYGPRGRRGIKTRAAFPRRVLGRSQVVRQRILIPPSPGSNPGAPASRCGLCRRYGRADYIAIRWICCSPGGDSILRSVATKLLCANPRNSLRP